MAYDRGGASGGNGSKSYKDTLKEYKAFYEERHGGGGKSGFSNSQSRSNNSPPQPQQLGGNGMAKLLAKVNAASRQINPEPDDPYYSNRATPGSKVRSTSGPSGRGYNAVPYQAWKNNTPSRQSTVNAPAYPGTAPDTPNLVRQHIETSPRLLPDVKASARNTWSDYSMGNSWNAGARGGGGSYNIPTQTIRSKEPFSPGVSEHEAIHADQFRNVKNWDDYDKGSAYGMTNSYRTIRDDVWQVAGEGNKDAQDFYRNVLPIYENIPSFQYNPEMYPYEFQAWMASGNANEFPQWFKDRHLRTVLTPETLNAPVYKYPVRWR